MRGTPRIWARTALLLALVSVMPASSRADDTPAQDSRRKQEIIFDEIPEHSAADAPFDVSAKSTSGLPVAWEVVSGPAVPDAGKLKLTGSPGLVIVRASQAGNALFQPAKVTERAFNVRPKPSAPEFTEQPVALNATVGGAILISVEVSGEPKPSLQWRKDGNPISGATDRTLSIPQSGPADAGSYDVVARNDSGTAVSQRVGVGVEKRSQFVSFQAPSGQLQAGQPVTLNATTSSGLTVQLEVTSGMGYISGSTLTAQSGSVTVRASQPGNSEFEAATPVSQTLVFESIPGRL
jgi:hypothetical protein